jgi:hypothetical protein
MDDTILAFADRHPDAAMITLRPDGSAHMARIEVAVVDGRLWSSGSPALVRTRNLRRDPRCSLFLFGPHPYWLGLEAEVTLIEGPAAPDLHGRLMLARHKDRTPEGMVWGHDDAIGGDRLYALDEYVEHIRVAERLIYEFSALRVYGNPDVEVGRLRSTVVPDS